MTLSETRKLGIEFERRVQTMIPEKEYLDKLDTETIYAYLNSYQDKYIHDIYRNLDNIKSGSKMSAHVESVLQEMLRTQTIDINDAKNYTGDITDVNGIVIVENGRSVTYPLDPSFYMYVRSVSNVVSTYSFKSTEPKSGKQRPIRVLPNELVSQSDVWRLLETPHNSLRILRYPAASIGAYEVFGEQKRYTVSVHDPLLLTVNFLKNNIMDIFRDGIANPQEVSLPGGNHANTSSVATSAFRINTYSDEEPSDDYTIEYTGSSSQQFNYCVILNNNGTYSIGSNGVQTGNIEAVKTALFGLDPEDPETVPFIFAWPNDKTDDTNIITVYKNHQYNVNFNENKEYTKEEIVNILPASSTTLNNLDDSSDGSMRSFEYDGFTYYITLHVNSNSLPTLNVIYDQYTTPVGVKIIYYAQPQRFDLMTSTRCELPMDAFDDLVTGAVDLYIQYVAGAEANKRRIEQAKQQAAKQEQQQNNKKNGNDEE